MVKFLALDKLNKYSCPWPWNLYVDGSSTKDSSGAGLIFESPARVWCEHVLKFMFEASNNEVKYEALVAGIELCYTAGADHIQTFSDSQLVVSQLNEAYERRMMSWPPTFRGFGRPPSY